MGEEIIIKNSTIKPLISPLVEPLVEPLITHKDNPEPEIHVVETNTDPKSVPRDENDINASVSFVLIAINAADDRRIGLNHNLNVSLNKPFTTAFNFKIIDDTNNDDLRLLIQQRAIQNSGFEISLDQIQFHGKSTISNDSDEMTYLFSVEVDKLTQKERTTTNQKELLSSVSWISMEELPKLEDCKSQAIVLRRMMSRNGLVFISSKRK